MVFNYSCGELYAIELGININGSLDEAIEFSLCFNLANQTDAKF